jgi:hypothetical protein
MTSRFLFGSLSNAPPLQSFGYAIRSRVIFLGGHIHLQFPAQIQHTTFLTRIQRKEIEITRVGRLSAASAHLVSRFRLSDRASSPKGALTVSTCLARFPQQKPQLQSRESGTKSKQWNEWMQEKWRRARRNNGRKAVLTEESWRFRSFLGRNFKENSLKMQ